MLVVQFKNKPVTEDGDLPKKILGEIDLIQQKMIRAYLEMAEKHGKQGLWDEGVLPDFFWKGRAEVNGKRRCVCVCALLSAQPLTALPVHIMQRGWTPSCATSTRRSSSLATTS
jgi:hypothetical protein